jgi:hypothetical protein
MITDQLIDQLFIGLVLQVLMTLGLAMWGRWVAKRRGGGRAWVWAARGPWVSLVLLTLGTLVSVRMLNSAFHQVQAASASDRQHLLSNGIAKAMRVSAIFLIPGYSVLLVCVTMFIVGSLRAAASTTE